MKKDNLFKLNTNLTEEHIDFKVKQLFKGKNGVFGLILPYKDARVDMDVLDDIATPSDWQNEYKRDSKGVLQCGIGIYVDELDQWVWKWSNGTPSDFESEKGEYSDAFKRAGFMWGIGRSLYEFPKLIIQLNDDEYYEKDGKPKASNGFNLNHDPFSWIVDEDYSRVRCFKRYGSSKKERINTNPHKRD